MGLGWDLCVGLLYEYRFAVLITIDIGINPGSNVEIF